MAEGPKQDTKKNINIDIKKKDKDLDKSADKDKDRDEKIPVHGEKDKKTRESVDLKTKELKENIEELLRRTEEQDGEIAVLQEKNKEYKNEYLRQVAEKENLRKRLEREKADYFQYAMADIFKEFLDILDNFERALETEESPDKKHSFREGIEMIHKQIGDMLRKYDVAPIQESKAFDPNLHQAFMTEESEEVKVPEISQIFQKGYMLGSRLLRPALVKVTVPKKEKG
jgi:molecular chaperone GrpE